MPLKIDDSDLQKLLKDIEDAVREAKNDFIGQMRKATLVVEAEAKIRSSGRPGPNVVTGRHRSSISSMAEEMEAGVRGVVGAGAHYSPYLEYGTSRAPAYPYLRPAVEAKEEEIMRLLDAVLKGIQDRILRR